MSEMRKDIINMPIVPVYYHDKYKGDFTATGASITGNNTLVWLKAPEITDPEVFSATRGYIDIPPTATVEKAYLIISTSRFVPDFIAEFGNLYFRTPASASANLSDATHIYIPSNDIKYSEVPVYKQYAYFADVTNLVKDGGTGNYWVYNFIDDYYTKANVPVKAGWSLYVYYKDQTMSYKDLSYYWGVQSIGVDYVNPLTLTVGVVKTPAQGPVLGRVGITTKSSTGGESDRVTVNDVALSDPYTPPNDFANSISTLNGELMNTWPPQTIPSSDATTSEFQVKVIALNGTEIPNSATSITVKDTMLLEGPSAEDHIEVVAFAFQLYEVDLSVDKSNQIVIPASDGIHDTIEYTVVIKNTSTYATGINSFFTDTIPSKMTYVSESMRIISNSYGGYTGILTDAQDSDQGYFNSGTQTVNINIGRGATGTLKGNLNPGDTITVAYRAIINNTAVPGDIIVNTAVITSTAQDTNETFVITDESSIKVKEIKRGIKFI